ncbi:bacillithiol biosynthesis cysteine-adding enzyme BshC [Bacillus sp. FJAT-18017]|uniref:bacillithiol biosynthesis cysteine-adding enzyme BshC n=1 Tax=Bacillus sp. FJAT-18017 TaxID=1705566 RepID=UPI0006AEEB02|nr:bacillithiol biosynthesis cysteine-adding enzyme BshC [Bacillus sp. FJAT-18017]ALC91086.1 bacillithiol biosynthesis cysteine-adding enzyme BshC [Bacillus sp. FJAT-18017]
MEVSNLLLPAANPFASYYLQQTNEVMPFFHYTYNEPGADRARLDELATRQFPREELAVHIEKYMARFQPSAAIKNSLEKLKRPDSAVIIGGQQAGILTGPLYSIHKVISIIQLARQKEKELGIPVVPVFWIAGEDHDYQEVNHVYVPIGTRADKWIFPQKVIQKKMVTDIRIDKELCRSWVASILSLFGETGHTRQVKAFMEDALKRSETFTDFFGDLITGLFPDSGLLLIDSGNPELREIERSRFEDIILGQEAIISALLRQQEEISKGGFPKTIDASENSANLFYYDKTINERVLLDFDPMSGCFVGNKGSLSFTLEELLQIARNEPASLSNNVVTRPLMQEWLFPVLSFIGGPGEIAYWAELKLVFENFGMKMPPIVPRLNITFIDRTIERDIQELDLNVSETIRRGTGPDEERYLDSIQDPELESVFQNAIKEVNAQYRRIEDKTIEIEPAILALVKKNESIILSQIGFMQKKLEEAIKMKHSIALGKFNRVSLELRPEGSPQERVWNILYYVNKFGLDFPSRLLELEYEFDGTHKLVRI